MQKNMHDYINVEVTPAVEVTPFYGMYQLLLIPMYSFISYFHILVMKIGRIATF